MIDKRLEFSLNHHNIQEKVSLVKKIFHKYGVVRKYKKKTFIFKEGDEPEAIYFIQNGLIKVSQTTQSGHNVTFFLRRKGEVIGVSEVLLNKNRMRYAQCLQDSQVCIICAQDFIALIKDPDISLGLLIITLSHFLETQINITTLLTKPVSWRLAWLLKQLGDKMENGDYHFTLKLSHEEISHLIGCSRQKVTEILNRWKQQELVTVESVKLCKMVDSQK